MTPEHDDEQMRIAMEKFCEPAEEPSELARDLDKLTKGQLLSLLANAGLDVHEIVRDKEAQWSVPLPNPGKAYLFVSYETTGDPDDDEAVLVPVSWLDELERRGMTKSEAVACGATAAVWLAAERSDNRKEPPDPAAVPVPPEDEWVRVVHWFRDERYDADGKPLEDDDD